MKIKIILLLLALSIAMPFWASADDSVVETERLFEALPSDAQEKIGEITPSDGDPEQAAQSLLDSALDAFKEQIQSAAASGFMILAICVIASLVGGFAQDSGIGSSSKIVDTACVCGILTVCFSSAGSVLSDALQAVTNLEQFSKVLIPVFASAGAIAGKPMGSIASAGATILFSDLIITLSRHVFIPMLYAFLIAVCAGALSENSVLTRAAEFVKWFGNAFFKAFLIAFTAYLSLSGLIAGSADAAAVKTAQAVSGAVPVVGSIISGTSEALLSGASMLRGTIGLFGTVGAISICLVPFVRVLCHFLVFKVLAIFSGGFASGAATKAIDGVSDGYSIALGILATCCAVQFIAIVVSMVVCAT